MTKPDSSELDIVKKGIATAALLAGATEGQVAGLDADGELVFVDGGGGGGALPATDGVTSIAAVTSLHLPAGSLTDLGSGEVGLEYLQRIGPFPLDHTDFIAAAGTAITLGDELPVDSLVYAFVFFPHYFSSPCTLQVGLQKDGGPFVGSSMMLYDANAPDDENADWGNEGIYNPAGSFPRHPIYRVKNTGVHLVANVAADQSAGLSRGDLVVSAFVFQPVT